MFPRASRLSKLVGSLDASDALDGMDVATGVATAKGGDGLGFGGFEALAFGGKPDRRHAGTEPGVGASTFSTCTIRSIWPGTSSA